MTGFVLSLTCCLSLPGAVFGLVGLPRTRQGRFRGRWAAVCAVVIGFLATLATAGLITLGVLADEPVEELRVGDCFDADDLDERSDPDDVLGIEEVSCDGRHRAEVLARVELSADQARDLEDDPIAVCNAVLEEEGVDPALVRFTDPPGFVVPLTATATPDPGDVLVCAIAAEDDVTTDEDDAYFTGPYDQGE